MKTLFNVSDQQELMKRIESLKADSFPVWGKMTSAQMLTHCARALQVPAGDLALKRSLIRHLGRFFKSTYIGGGKPFPKNGPTAKEFIVSDPRMFEEEKERFLCAFRKLAAGPGSVIVFEHGFFGKMTAEEWGILMYKHVDHHLQQFGL